MARHDLNAAAQDLIGPDEQVRAAGIFALQDNYAAITVAGLAAGAATPPGAGPSTDGISGILGMEAAREANAATKEVTERMLVAVTDGAIHILAMPRLGATPERELMSFDRRTTEVGVKKFGLSRRLNLVDTQARQELGLTGSAVPFSLEAKGDKAVLAELGR